jgi:hypothetical protein
MMARYTEKTSGAHAHAGKTILEIIWEELDAIMDRLMSDGEPSKATLIGELEDGATSRQAARELADEWWETLRAWGEERGQAQGVAYCIAVLTNPYHVDVDAIRAQAMERWQERQGQEDLSPEWTI